MFKFGFVLLLVSLSVYSQPRPTGGPEPVDPGNDPSYASEIISLSISNNMGMCDLRPEYAKHVKDLKEVHALFQKLQIEYLVRAFPKVDVQTDAKICEAAASHLSPEILCLMTGSEDSFAAFTTNPKAAKFLKGKLKMSQEETIKAMEFFSSISKPLIESKKKRVE